MVQVGILTNKTQIRVLIRKTSIMKEPQKFLQVIFYNFLKLARSDIAWYIYTAHDHTFSSQHNQIKLPVGKICILLPIWIHWKIKIIVKLKDDKDGHFWLSGFLY